jgi:hypothetical protein
VEIHRYSSNLLPGDGSGSGGTQSFDDPEWKFIDILLIFSPEMGVGLEELNHLMILSGNS